MVLEYKPLSNSDHSKLQQPIATTATCDDSLGELVLFTDVLHVLIERYTPDRTTPAIVVGIACRGCVNILPYPINSIQPCLSNADADDSKFSVHDKP